MTEFEIWHVAIPVNSLEKMVQFYVEGLGFHLTGYNNEKSERQAFIATKPGGFTIELFQPLHLVGSQFNEPDHIAFECDDINTFRKMLMDKDWELPPVGVFENGVKYLAVTDPEGLLLNFFEGREIFDLSIQDQE